MIYLFFAFLAGVISDLLLYRYLALNKYPFTFIFSLLLCGGLLLTFDNQMLIIKGLIFAQSLIAAGYCDAKTHQIPNSLFIPILVAGLIYMNPLSSIIGLFLIATLLFLAAMINKGCIGGGDIKLVAASGFLLGAAGIFVGTLLAFTVFLITSAIFYRKKNNTNGFAMAPYISIGCYIAYILQI